MNRYLKTYVHVASFSAERENYFIIVAVAILIVDVDVPDRTLTFINESRSQKRIYTIYIYINVERGDGNLFLQ